MVGGGVIMVAIMILILPIAVMLAGAIWSALMGWVLAEDAYERGSAPEQS